MEFFLPDVNWMFITNLIGPNYFGQHEVPHQTILTSATAEPR